MTERLGPLSSFQHKKLQMPTLETDLAYIAGLFDGEGCITHGSRGRPVLVIGMTDQGVMEWLASVTGIHLYIYEARPTISTRTRPIPTKSHDLPVYRWSLGRGTDVLAFLKAIEPWLRVKREKALWAINDLESNPDGRTLPRIINRVV